MNEILNETILKANNLAKELLLNTNVESFGILHQTYFIEFRNDLTEDILLTFDSEIMLHPQIDIGALNEDEHRLICLNKINLQKVTDVKCTDKSDIIIYFKNGISFKIFGSPKDETCIEPWQIRNNKTGKDSSLLIAINGNGYAIF